MKARTLRILVLALVVVTGSRATGQSALVGTVVSDPGENRLAQAEVIVAGVDRTIRSDSLGAFKLTGISPGMHRVTVRLAGYQPWTGTLQFRDAQTVEVDFVLQAIATPLPGVDVNAHATTRNPRLIEFEERRRSGVGKFISAEVFEKNNGRNLSSVILAQVSGVKLTEMSGEKILNSTRDGQSACPVQVVLNGIAVFTGAPTEEPFNIDGILTGNVLGLEYYTVAATPTRYLGTGGIAARGNHPQGAPCGTVIIWTK